MPEACPFRFRRRKVCSAIAALAGKIEDRMCVPVYEKCSFGTVARPFDPRDRWYFFVDDRSNIVDMQSVENLICFERQIHSVEIARIAISLEEHTIVGCRRFA